MDPTNTETTKEKTVRADIPENILAAIGMVLIFIFLSGSVHYARSCQHRKHEKEENISKAAHEASVRIEQARTICVADCVKAGQPTFDCMAACSGRVSQP